MEENLGSHDAAAGCEEWKGEPGPHAAAAVCEEEEEEEYGMGLRCLSAPRGRPCHLLDLLRDQDLLAALLAGMKHRDPGLWGRAAECLGVWVCGWGDRGVLRKV